uniref:Ty3 transposon capsid-like protein domain-containing protein n=1 Tax=Chenopodium quinoa TaxID=63459 RepID=A0A803MHB4_CHEQI
MEAHLQALENRLDAQTLASTQKFEALMQMMQSLKDNMAEARTPRSEDQFNQPKLGYIPKLEFLKFDGSNPRLWIKKCCKYFTLCKSPDEQKVDLASLNMIAKAENWVSGYLSTRSAVDWNDFVIDINGRFKDEVGVNLVEEFNKLQQIGNIESYIDEFENLKAIMLQNSYALPEKYLLESFVGGLKLGINHLLEPLNLKFPTCLMQVFELEAEPDEFKALKKTFADVFDEPTDLPPSRGVFDHRIPLEPRRGAVKIMPYRYPLKAKGCNRAVGP